MTLTKTFFSGAFLAAALCVGATDVTSSNVYSAEEQAAVATSGAQIDWTLFDVPEGKDMAFYRDRWGAIMLQLRTLYGKDAANVPEETKIKVQEKIGPAYKIILAQLMNDPDAEKEERDMFFQMVLTLFSNDDDIAGLEALLKTEKANEKPNAERVAIMEATLFSMGLRQSIDANDVAAVQKKAAELVELANTNNALASQLEGVTGLIGRVDQQLAEKTLKTIVENFKASNDVMRQSAARGLEGALRFMSLKGSEMVFEGVFMDGTEVDWESYRGKVVLIDFFATWCGPCMAEVPNIEKNYKRFHDAGFEVISFSVDADLDALKKYEEKAGLPWKCVSQTLSMQQKNDKGEPKYRNLAAYYGINSIPRMILVGKDGKVIDAAARGERLTELLEKEFPKVK